LDGDLGSCRFYYPVFGLLNYGGQKFELVQTVVYRKNNVGGLFHRSNLDAWLLCCCDQVAAKINGLAERSGCRYGSWIGHTLNDQVAATDQRIGYGYTLNAGYSRLGRNFCCARDGASERRNKIVTGFFTEKIAFVGQVERKKTCNSK